MQDELFLTGRQGYCRWPSACAKAPLSGAAARALLEPSAGAAATGATRALTGMAVRTSLTARVCAASTCVGAASAAGLPQTAVAYQTTPKDGKQCDQCNLFVAPNSCKSVAGEIVPSGWCKLWVKKA